MDIKFDKLSTEAQMYAMQNNVDGGKIGVIEEANGELQTLLTGLGKTDAAELMGDSVSINQTAKNRAAENGTNTTVEQLEKHYNNAPKETKEKILESTVADISGTFQAIDARIQEATDEVLGLQEIKLIETSNELSSILKRIGDNIYMPSGIKGLVTLLMNKVEENKTEALNKYRESIREAIRSYDAAYVTSSSQMGARTIPGIEDAVDVITGRVIGSLSDTATWEAFGLNKDDFAEKCATMSNEELKEALETYISKMESLVAKSVDEKILPAAKQIREKMTENYTKTMTSILKATLKGDVEIPNPIAKTVSSTIQAKLDGTYKEGNIDTSDVKTVYTFLDKVNDDYQANATGVEAPATDDGTPKIVKSSYKTQTEIYTLRGKTVFVSDYQGRALRQEPLDPCVHKGFFKQDD